MDPMKELDPKLAKKLLTLQPVPARNPEKAKLGRAEYIRQAQAMAASVTPRAKTRHNGWMHAIQTFTVIPRKEHSPMFSTLATILLLVSAIFGGGGATVALAQSSQPGQLLYGVKLLSEDARLGLTTNPQQEWQVALQFAQRRALEIQNMVNSGNPVSATIQSRYQNQVESAIRLAAGLSNDQAIQALEQIRAQLHTQEQSFLQLQAGVNPKAEASLAQIQQMLQECLNWVETGIGDPDQLRTQLRDQTHDQDQVRTRDQLKTQSATGASQPSGAGSLAPTNTGSGNPWTTETPTPGSGYGPGPGPEPTRTCTPGIGIGPGPQATPYQNNQPTEAGPQPTQYQVNQPTQAGPQGTQEPNRQPYQTPQGPNATPGGPGGPGGNH